LPPTSHHTPDESGEPLRASRTLAVGERTSAMQSASRKECAIEAARSGCGRAMQDPVGATGRIQRVRHRRETAPYRTAR